MDLFDNADEFYGTDDHGEEVIEDNTDIVTLPEGRFTLQGEQLVQFHAVIDPFQEREDYGIDLYLSVLELITNMARRMTTLVNLYIYCVSK